MKDPRAIFNELAESVDPLFQHLSESYCQRRHLGSTKRSILLKRFQLEQEKLDKNK